MNAPDITSIAPSTGPSSGGTQVSIAGSGLSSVTKVLFGNTAALDLPSVSDSLILAVSPPSSTLGNTDITVQTPNGNAIWFDAFEYTINVTSIYPASGVVTGGQQVTIHGSGLTQVASVLFNDTPASTFSATSDTQIQVTTPPSSNPGTADISLLNSAGSTLYVEFGGYTYTAAPAAAPASPPSTSPSPAPATGSPAPSTPAPNKNTADPSSPSPAKDPPANTPAKDPAANPPATNPPNKPAAPGDTTGDGSQTPPPSGPAKPASPGGATNPPASSTPTPSGDYIPLGRVPVPDGKTGLGGSAGTGAGFGVGTLMAGGGGSAAPSNLPYYVDPALTTQIVQSLLTMAQTATSPDAIEAQNMLLRRMALEGDVVGSRIPPPRNISEIGGYINLLSTLKENTMREQTLAGILGVAGPAQPLGWITNTQPLSMVAIPNDRPPVAAQHSFPLTVLVRSDFVSAVQSALKTLHSYGATLPMVSPSVIMLPPGGTGSTIPNNLLFYLGRILNISPAAGLINPSGDPIALLAPSGTSINFALVSQVLNAATFQVPAADVNAVQCTPTTQTIIPLSQYQSVPIAPILSAAGYYSAQPFPVPANSTSLAWASLYNTTGLITGHTQLGDELSLLYRQDQIASSALAAMLSWTWNGSTFAP
ncbi:IPT/TIG domain-containing protein [Telmatobacter sp. DSM 110680]|uniref:IPT/TIG domain-containing protein n=1 Tax=Telmatobacter sp. DSM 110680 TaxID=3036704 RepID=A0AAU7DMZ2_9BACT